MPFLRIGQTGSSTGVAAATRASSRIVGFDVTELERAVLHFKPREVVMLGLLAVAGWVHGELGEDWKPHHNPWLVAFTVTLATFMEVLDTSISNVALPHIGGTGWEQARKKPLGADQLPGGERHRAAHLRLAGESIGPQALLYSCVAMFTVCSLLCGLAQTLPMLIFAQVCGCSGRRPSEQAILADTFPIEQRGQAFALYGMAVVVAPAIGPDVRRLDHRTTSTGTGSSSSTCRWALVLSISPIALWKIRRS